MEQGMGGAVSAQLTLATDRPRIELSTPKPFIKWVGGKRQLLPSLLKRVPAAFGTYFEPFLGGGALFFALRPRRAVLADLNERLVRTYRGVAADVGEVIGTLQGWPHTREHFEGLRGVDTEVMSDAELAAWFIYLNRTGFNGLYRVNRQNKFNVPFGRYVNPTICDEQGLRSCSAALAGAALCAGDFEEAVREAREGDFVYFDPPYVPVSEHSNFTRYTADTFDAQKQRRLRDVALDLKHRGVRVLLSNSSAPLVHELYAADFEIQEVDARRALNCRPDRRGAVTEVLIS